MRSMPPRHVHYGVVLVWGLTGPLCIPPRISLRATRPPHPPLPAALHVGHLCGSLDVGKYGDMVVIESPSWEHVIYEMGDGVPITHVFKRGIKAK